MACSWWKSLDKYPNSLSLTLDRSHQSPNCDTGAAFLLPCQRQDPGSWSTGSHVSMAGWELRVPCHLGSVASHGEGSRCSLASSP